MLANSSPLRPATFALAAVLLVAALPFGAVGPGPETALRVACGLVLALTVAGEAIGGPLRRVRWPLAGLVAVAAVGLLQALPQGGAVSPAHRAWADAARSLGATPSAAASLAPRASLDAAFDWLAVAAIFLAAASAGLSRRRRRVVLGGFLLAVAFQVLYGARNWLTGSREIWGVFVQSQPGRFKGTFVNPNHLALYLGLALAVLFAATAWCLRQARRRRFGDAGPILAGLPILGWMAVFAALVFTGSRSAFLGVVVATAAQGAAALRAASGRQGRWAVAGVAALAVLGVVAVLGTAGAGAFGRLAGTRLDDASLLGRGQAWAASLALWPSFPVLGAGLGAFDDAFSAVVPPQFGTSWWGHLHNDWLELFLTAGPLALMAAIAGTAALLARFVRLARDGESSEDRSAGIAGIGIVTFLAVMETAEFGLTNPANAATAAALLGLLASARLAASPEPSPEPSPLDDRPAGGPSPGSPRAAARPPEILVGGGL